MGNVRVLVGTRKGAFILTSDERREQWDVCGPHFAGWEIYHLKGSPVNPDRLYASQSSGWFGQVIQRSDDGGQTWEPVGNEFRYVGDPGTHQWYDGTQHPWEFTRVWHLEPSLSEPDTVYAGVEDAALFRSEDGGQSWEELPALRAAKGHLWQHGAGGMCLLHDRRRNRTARDGRRRDRAMICAFRDPGRLAGARSGAQSGNRLRALREIPGSIGEEPGSSPMAVSTRT